MRRRLGAACILLLSAFVFRDASLTAQTRFQVLGQEATNEIPGLRIVTIRDNQLDACYTVFLFEPSAPAEISAPVATTPDEAAQQSLQRIQDAEIIRDRQFSELRAARPS